MITEISYNRTKLLAIITIILMTTFSFSVVLLLIPSNIFADSEPNNNFITAEEIMPGSYIGTLNPSDTMDYYKIQLGSSSIVTITYYSDAVGGQQKLYFHNPSQIQILTLASGSNNVVSDTYYLANETALNYWYIKIEALTTIEYGNYSFSLIVDTQDDGGSGADVAEDYNYAFEILSGFDVNGILMDLDTTDTYKIYLESSSVLAIDFSSDANIGEQKLHLFNPTNNEVLVLSSSNNAIVFDMYYLANETAPEYWFIKINAVDRTEYGNYSFSVFMDQQDEMFSGGDVAKDYNNAYEIFPELEVHGIINYLDTADMYKILLRGGFIVTINYTSDAVPGEQKLKFYNPTLNEMFTIVSTANSKGSENYTIPRDLAEDFWYVEISGSLTEWGNYTFIVYTRVAYEKPPEISNISIDLNSWGVTFYWETNEPTNGSVYYGKNESYGFIEEDYSSYYTLSTTHIVTVYSLEAGETYHYKLVSWNELGIKNETLDDTLRMPRPIWVQSQHNSLRTFVFGEVLGKYEGSEVKIIIYCYDKGKAITPEFINVTSATAAEPIQLSELSTGVYKGTYLITQTDLDEEVVAIFADISYQGNNDTELFMSPLLEDVTEEDWVATIDYLSNEDRRAGVGDTVNLKITVTKDGVKSNPEDIAASVIEKNTTHESEGYYSAGIPLDTVNLGPGEYEISYTLPSEINISKNYEFEVRILNNSDSSWDFLSYRLDLFTIWYHQLNFTNKSAEFDIYVGDLENNVIPSADVEIILGYITFDDEEKLLPQKQQTDSKGMANFKFYYPDIDDDEFTLRGNISANGKTQYFDTYFTIPDGSIIEPEGDELEILPVILDEDIYSMYYNVPDAQGKVKKEYIVYSNSKLLINTEIYYYVLSGIAPFYSYLTEESINMDVVTTGNTVTDGQGKFSVEFKASSLGSATFNYLYYTVYIEAVIGNFEDIVGFEEISSNDGKYYAEASDNFIVTKSTFSFTLHDMISSNVKITIPKLNQGTPSNVEVSYTGSFNEPRVMVNYYPGTISPDTPLMTPAFTWGRWTEDEGIYLSKTNGKYTGQFTIPSYLPINTYSIIAIVQNAEAIDDELSLFFTDFIVINIVSLNIGESVKDGGYEDGANGPGEPSEEEIDTDDDGFSDAMEKRVGSDPNDPNSYPGSEENQDYIKIIINDVEIQVYGKTQGNISVKALPEESVPPKTKNIETDFNFYLNISCDKSISEVYIQMGIGLIGGDLIPNGTNEEQVKLFYFDAELNKWVEIKDSSYDSKTGILWAKVDHLTIFAPMVKASEKGDDTLIIAAIIVIIIVVIIIILSLAGIIQKKRRKGGLRLKETKSVPPAQITPEISKEDDKESDAQVGVSSEPTLASTSTTTQETPASAAPTGTTTTKVEDSSEPGEVSGSETEVSKVETTTLISETKDSITQPTKQEPSQKPDKGSEGPVQQLDQEPTLVTTTTQETKPPSQKPAPTTPKESQSTATQESPQTISPEDQEQQKGEKPESVQEVPCPICQTMIPVYSSPCSNCGTHLNW